jgi:sensor histidine kinase YesM
MFRTVKQLFGRNRFALIAFLFLLLDIGYYLVLITFGIGKRQATYEAVTSYLLILFFSYILQRIHTYYHSRSAINIVHISIIFIFSFLTSIFLQEYGTWVGQGDQHYLGFLAHAFFLRWFTLFLVFLTVVNQLWIDKHLDEQGNAFNRLIEKERLLAKAEINGLQQQFQPHFLFNSLNSISALVKTQPDQARTMVQNLSDYLRLSIQKSKDDFNTIEDELQFLNLYLTIEKVRFGHRLQIDINCEEGCKQLILPSLMLQPLVENAIKYGLYGNVGDLSITIDIQCADQMLHISVSNPYDETSVNSSKGTGYGLKSIERKLSFVYKRNDLLQTKKTSTQFTTFLNIPQEQASV